MFINYVEVIIATVIDIVKIDLKTLQLAVYTISKKSRTSRSYYSDILDNDI